MENKIEPTFTAKIYLAGDIELIKTACRKYCLNVGLCVTVTPTLFIYTGGEEYGCEVGIINYPRFPSTPHKLQETAIELAALCRDAAFQHSYLVLTPEDTIYNSSRPTAPSSTSK